MDDLNVAHYDEKEVETKKQSLIKRAAVAGGAVVLSLSLFNLNGCSFDPPIIAGGAGAWFHSCPEDECECTECECTNDECAPIVAGGAGAWYHSYTVDESESSEVK